jgi:DNA-binding SARP family transcriptional activator
MDFRLLGPLEVAEHDRSLPLGGAKQRSLLALLLLHANEVVPTERLTDELWGGSPPATVAKSIQVYVSRLRRELGDGRIATRTPGYWGSTAPSSAWTAGPRLGRSSALSCARPACRRSR